MNDQRASDLNVEPVSEALAGRHLDVVVSGSIGAVESVRFVRALRRLGANVTPWLTHGGARFVTPMSLSWAAGRDVREGFSGDASHIALADACVVAPASASLIAKVTAGMTDSPASALIASYLGMGKPVLMLPNMHDSLAESPAVKRNLETVATLGVTLLPARLEEGKRKFPEPPVLADFTAHILNKTRAAHKPVLITMGSTRGYIDDVRYISNYSSGKLGSLIAEELYRLGYATHVVAGPSVVRPRAFAELSSVATNDEMEAAAQRAMKGGAEAAVLAASVLDFTPSRKMSGKISSHEHEHLTVELTRTRKLIAGINPATGVKVGFKLETGLTDEKIKTLADRYIAEHKLSMMVINDLADVDEHRHKATVVEPHKEKDKHGVVRIIAGKLALARMIAAHVDRRLRGGT